jgi:hypothetical protein
MVERKAKRRDEKLEANGIKRKDWVAQAIALAGVHGTGLRQGKGKAAKGAAKEQRRADADRSEEE